MLEAGNVLLNTDFELELVPGGAAQALVEVAKARDADEIVLGSRGQGRVGSLLGSSLGGGAAPRRPPGRRDPLQRRP